MRRAPTKLALRITATEARRLAITGQRLAGPRPRATRASILRLIRDLGYVQLDPTNVVARNPHLVVWSRVGRYDPAILEGLLAEHREVFETMSGIGLGTNVAYTPALILPMSDLPLHAATMRAHRGGTAGRGWGPSGRGKWAEITTKWFAENGALRRRVLRRLRREGPLPLTAFTDRAIVSWTSGDWASDRNVSRMLAILQRRGDVVVAGRVRGQKLWAAADERLPRVRPLAPTIRARAATLRTLDAMGLATMKQLRAYYAFKRDITPAAVASLEREGRVVRVEIANVPGIWFATSDIARRERAVREQWDARTTLLSPFDSLIMDRLRLEELFGYSYRIEIYTPVHLRKRGYWAMPVLHGDRIVGSVDPRVDRERGELVVNRVVLEPGAPRSARPAIRRAVAELAEFVGAARVRWPPGASW
jgi:uncharacterized protein